MEWLISLASADKVGRDVLAYQRAITARRNHVKMEVHASILEIDSSVNAPLVGTGLSVILVKIPFPYTTFSIFIVEAIIGMYLRQTLPPYV